MLNLLLLSVLVAGAHARCYLRGATYPYAVVTINEEDQPYWYQAKFANCIDGDILQDFTSRKLELSSKPSYGSIEVSNFPDLTEIFMKGTDRVDNPYFFNLPKVTTIYMNNNRLRNITAGHYNHIPVKTLIFSNNEITFVGKGSFGPELQKITLTCNKLTTISSNWFTGKSSLKELGLTGNKILAVPDNFLNGFTNMQQLVLRNNEILTVGKSAFVGSRNLNQINLSYNNITDLKANSFPPEGFYLRFFDIQYNRLSFLTEEMMSRVLSPKIKIWGNPWQCPCLTSIQNWQFSNGTDRFGSFPRDEDPTCVVASSFSQTCVPVVDEELYNIFIASFELYYVDICRRKGQLCGTL